jgi:hypothetical protein
MSTVSTSDMRSRLKEAIKAADKARGRPLTAREKLNNLTSALSEHDSDCGWHEGARCNCGADDFRAGFIHLRSDS